MNKIRAALKHWAHLALASAGGVWLMIPEQMRASVPHNWLAWGAIVLAALGITGAVLGAKDTDGT